MQENTGTVTLDLVNGNTATLSGAIWGASGRFGNAIKFDGSDDSLLLSSNIALSSNFTVTTWFNKNDNYNFHSFCGKLNDTGNGSKIALASTNNLFMRIVPGGDNINFNNGYTSSHHQTWTFLALQRASGNIIHSCINGASLLSGGALSGTYNFDLIGANNNGQYFGGYLQDFRVYDKALTQSQITNLYNNGGPDLYRLQSVEYIEGDDALVMELSDVDEFLLGNIAELNKKMDINNVYGQGATNIWQVGPLSDNFQRVDAGTVYKTTLKIYIPEEAIAINKVKINWTLGGFRTYTKVASTTTGNPSATHTHSTNIDNSMDTGNDCHMVGFQGNVAFVVDSGFVPSTWGTNANTANHTHEISVSHGIFVAGDESPTIQLDVNSTTIASNYTGDQQDIDITDNIVRGWNTIEIFPAVGSNTKGHIQVDAFVQCFIESK